MNPSISHFIVKTQVRQFWKSLRHCEGQGGERVFIAFCGSVLWAWSLERMSKVAEKQEQIPRMSNPWTAASALGVRSTKV